MVAQAEDHRGTVRGAGTAITQVKLLSFLGVLTYFNQEMAASFTSLLTRQGHRPFATVPGSEWRAAAPESIPDPILAKYRGRIHPLCAGFLAWREATQETLYFLLLR